MDLLNRAYSQLDDLYRSMTPGSRLTAGLLAAMVLLGAGYLFTRQSFLPQVDLMDGVPVAAGQLPAIRAAFGKANLKGYEVRGTSIYVPRGQEAEYMAALVAGNAIPPALGAAMREAANGDTLFNLGSHEQRMRIAKQDELARAICLIPGIERAYVLSDVESRPSGFKDKTITATACVKPAGAGQLDKALVSAIRGMVAGAIAGLKPEGVAVSDLNSGRTWHGNIEEGAGASENVYVSLKRVYEQDLKAKILNALRYIPNVTVELSVELDCERVAHGKPDRQSPAAMRPGSGDSSNSRNKAGSTGRPAASAQQPNTATILENLLGGSRGGDDAAEPEATAVVANQQQERERVGLTPTSAKVAVNVPMSYFQNIWHQQNPAEPGKPTKQPDQDALDRVRGEETAKVQKLVAQLLPLANGAANAADLVTVTPFLEIPVQEPPVPAFSENMLSWLRQSWGTLGMIALALAGLLVLRSLVHPRSAAADVPTSAISADPDIETAVRLPPLFHPLTQSDSTTLVRHPATSFLH